MQVTCHPYRGPQKSVDFWGVDRLGGACQRQAGVTGISAGLFIIVPFLIQTICDRYQVQTEGKR